MWSKVDKIQSLVVEMDCLLFTLPIYERINSMVEDFIEKACCNCDRTFNWEWVGCFFENQFFCSTKCVKKMYPDMKGVTEAPIERILNGKKN